jgi:hypothetical protein
MSCLNVLSMYIMLSGYGLVAFQSPMEQLAYLAMRLASNLEAVHLLVSCPQQYPTTDLHINSIRCPICPLLIDNVNKYVCGWYWCLGEIEDEFNSVTFGQRPYALVGNGDNKQAWSDHWYIRLTGYIQHSYASG